MSKLSINWSGEIIQQLREQQNLALFPAPHQTAQNPLQPQIWKVLKPLTSMGTNTVTPPYAQS